MIKIENLIIKKCEKCGSTIRVLNDSNTISCCGEDMKTLTPQYEDNNSHVPNLVKKDRTLYITMDHVMEENHYIKNIFIILLSIIASRILYALVLETFNNFSVSFLLILLYFFKN